MKFSDVFNSMSFSEAADFIAHYESHLDNIFDLGGELSTQDTPNGIPGTVWRTVYAKPRNITPIAFYLGDKARNTRSTLAEYEKDLKSKDRKIRKECKRAEQIEGDLKGRDTRIEQLQKETDELNKELDSLEATSIEELKESVRVLFKKCQENGIKVEAHELPHIHTSIPVLAQ